MKRSLVLLLMPLLAITACKKEDPKCPEVTTTAPSSEVATLRTYIQANSIIAVEDPRGFFYRVEAQGSGATPTPCSDVTVSYVGKLTNGGTFDSNNNASFNLGQLITGWKLGLPLISSGGRIILYLPPSLGYGSSPAGSIPGNSILIFDITLKSVN